MRIRSSDGPDSALIQRRVHRRSGGVLPPGPQAGARCLRRARQPRNVPSRQASPSSSTTSTVPDLKGTCSLLASAIQRRVEFPGVPPPQRRPAHARVRCTLSGLRPLDTWDWRPWLFADGLYHLIGRGGAGEILLAGNQIAVAHREAFPGACLNIIGAQPLHLILYTPGHDVLIARE